MPTRILTSCLVLLFTFQTFSQEIDVYFGKENLTTNTILKLGRSIEDTTVSNYFMIVNTAVSGDLVLDSNPIRLSGGAANFEFTVESDLSDESIAVDDTLYFQIDFSGSYASTYATNLEIYSNDSDEDPFRLSLTADVVERYESCELPSTGFEDFYTTSTPTNIFVDGLPVVTYKNPVGWSPTFSLLLALFGGEVGIDTTSDARTGDAALELFYDGSAYGDLHTIIYCKRDPDALSGYYKFEGAATDSAYVVVSSGGLGSSTNGNTDTLFITSDASGYTLFEIDIPYDVSSNDSILVGLATTANTSATFIVDDLELMGGSDPLDDLVDQQNDSLPKISNGSADWGDYDNDGDLDIVITGSSFQNNSSTNYSKVYRNNGDNTFTEQAGITLAPLTRSSCDWGDYNNDGLLDILIAGRDNSSNRVSKVYQNNGDNTFTEQTGISLVGIDAGTVKWIDYNADGNLDICISGETALNEGKTIIYKNNGNLTFTEIDNSGYFQLFSTYGSQDWADFNDDGYADIVVAGDYALPGINRRSEIFLNNGDDTFTFHKQLTAIFDGVAKWGDFDDDGDYDVLLSGFRLGGVTSEIWRTTSGSLSNQTSIDIIDLYRSNLGWGDYDSDGDLDFLLSGTTTGTSSGSQTYAYENAGGNSFTQTDLMFADVHSGFVQWGDYDNDQDLDLLLGGTNIYSEGTTKLYRNTFTSTNTQPSAPANTSSTIDGRTVTLSWDQATDTETVSSGLSYNVYVGTSSEGQDYIPSMSDLSDGYRRVVGEGNAYQNTNFTLRNLPGGVTYYWGVQAIDNSFIGGPFSPESTFMIPLVKPDIQAMNIEVDEVDTSSVQLSWSNGNGYKRVVFIKQGDYSEMPPIDNTSYAADTVFGDGSQIGTSGWFCVYNGIDSVVSVSGLQPGLEYQVQVYEFDGPSGSELYFTEDTTDNPVSFNTTFFKEVASIAFSGIARGSIHWGDFDNDDDLDVLLSGAVSGSTETAIYRNDGNDVFIEETGISLDAIQDGASDWVDYNADGYLDVFIVGDDGSGKVAKLYKNNGDKTFTEQNFSFEAVDDATFAWADYDGDGDLDVFLTGRNSSNESVSHLYRNQSGEGFEKDVNAAQIPGYLYPVVQWVDYDNDSDLDLFITGLQLETNQNRSEIFEQTQSGLFVEDEELNILGWSYPSADWADYDGDGDFDLVINGRFSSGLTIYQNDGTGSFTSFTVSDEYLYRGSLQWVDYNNDGYLDISETGLNFENSARTNLYRNDGTGGFSKTQDPFIDVRNGALSWGDYDNDGDLDVVLFGTSISNYTKLYKNFRSDANDPPTVPTNLNTSIDGNSAILSWDIASDNVGMQASLTYNIYVSSSSTSDSIMPTSANIGNGFRRVVGSGNAYNKLSYRISDLPGGSTYYWSVQTIDQGYLGSAFATEVSFAIPTSRPSDQAANIHQLFGDEGSTAISWTNGSGSRRLVFMKASNTGEAVPIDNTTYAADITFGSGDQIGTSGWYCVYNGNGSSVEVGGLNAASAYRVMVIEYDGSTGNELYNITTTENNPRTIESAWFVPSALNVQNARGAELRWGDYDNDSDLDLLFIGFEGTFPSTVRITKIYRNNGNGTFTAATATDLPGISQASGDWGDYDGDGFLDLIISGEEIDGGGSVEYVTRIYKNDGDGSFTEQSSIELLGLNFGSTDWGDYDNDGDLDILLTGNDQSSNRISKIYRNNGDNTFTDQTSISISGVSNSDADWVDYNGDGYLDFVIIGLNNTVVPLETGGTTLDRIAEIYKNNGDGTFTMQSSLNLTGGAAATTDWGDYDGDGDMDLLLSGEKYEFTGATVSTSIHKNLGNGTFEEIQIDIEELEGYAGKWADYDNDGDLDFLIMGTSTNNVRKTILYRNDGNDSFIAQPGESLADLQGDVFDWGDYDNDGDLDIAVSRIVNNTFVLQLYENKSAISNSLPSAPTNLQYAYDGEDVIISWDQATDSETSQQGLTYNVNVAIASGDQDIKPAMSDLTNGYRRLTIRGNASQNTSYRLRNLPADQTIYWTVQAVDNALAGSTFATEASFQSKKEQTITFGSIDAKTYGDPAFDPSATSTSALTVNYISSNEDVAVIESGLVRIVGVGSTTIKAYQEGDSDYLPADTIEQVLEVDKAPLTIATDDKTRSYGEKNQLTISYTGFVYGEDESVLTVQPDISIGADSTSSPGTYTIGMGIAEADNYAITREFGTLTIEKAELIVTAEDQERAYGDTNPTLSLTYTGFVLNEGLDEINIFSRPTANTTATPSSDAGTYDITVSGGNDTNYSFTHVSGTLTVTPTTLTVTADDQLKTYGEVNPELTLTYAGFVNDEDEGILTTVPTAATLADETSGTGTFDITVDGGAADNYLFDYVAGTLTVAAATLTVTPSDAFKTYGEANPEFGINYFGFVNGEDVSALTILPTATTSAVETSNVGEYDITASGADADNYTFEYLAGTLTIDKAVLTVTANDQTRLYGDLNPSLTFSYSGFLNGDDQSVLTTEPGASTPADETTAVGTYTITLNGGVDNNYDFSYVNGNLTIEQAELTVTADDLVRSYGASNSALTISYSGFVNEEDQSALNTAPEASTLADETTEVGTYAIIVEGGVDNNYAFSYVNGNLTIEQAELTVTADDQIRSYGELNPTLTISYSGFVNEEDESELTTVPVSSTLADETSDVGDYSIDVSGGVADNYSFVYVEGTLSINKADQSIEFDPFGTVFYGDSDFDLTANASSGLSVEYSSSNENVALIDGNTISIISAGTTEITASQPGDANYNAADEVAQTLTVNPSFQIITMEPFGAKTYGDSDFEIVASSTSGLSLTFSSSNEDVATVSDNLITILGSGTTAIRAFQEGNQNFTSAEVTQDLVVDKLDQSISFNALDEKIFGDQNFQLEATIDSDLQILYTSSDQSVATVDGAEVTIQGAGSTVIAATQPGDDNHNPATSVEQTLTINKAGQSIAFDNQLENVVYGDPDTELTASATSGLAVSFSSSNESVAIVNGTSLSVTGAGSATITASQSGDANYLAATSVTRTLEVAKADQTITFEPLEAQLLSNSSLELTASSSSGLEIVYTSSNPAAATVSGNVVTLVADGITTITATQPGDDNHNAAAPIEQELEVIDDLKTDQTITFTALDAVTFGDPDFELTATATSSLDVTYTSSDELVAVVNGTTVNIVGAGSTTITADQAGNDEFNAAPSVSQELVVNKADQQITFEPPTEVSLATQQTLELTASSSSGLLVTINLISGPAELNGNILTLTGEGTVILEATQSGDANFNGAVAVQAFIEIISQQLQTITFDSLTPVTFGDADFELTATASSSLTVSYESSDPTVASVSGSTVSIVGAGSTVITASQAGNEDFLEADPVEQELVVNKLRPDIIIDPIDTVEFGDPDFEVSATSTSPAPIMFTSLDTTRVQVNGNMVTIMNTGLAGIRASQEETDNYTARSANEIFFVAPGPQQIVFELQPDAEFGSDPITLSGQAVPTGATVWFSSSNPEVAQALITLESDTILEIRGVGTTTIEANAGTVDAYPNYRETSVFREFTVVKGSQIITFETIPEKSVGDPDFELIASASSGLPITFVVDDETVATVAGNVVAIVGAGTTGIEARQEGNENYLEASLMQELVVQDVILIEPGEKRLEIYPNPVDQVLTIAAGKSGIDRIQIYSMSGELVMETINPDIRPSGFEIDVSNLASGNYMINLTTEGKVHSVKIVKH